MERKEGQREGQSETKNQDRAIAVLVQRARSKDSANLLEERSGRWKKRNDVRGF